MCRASVLTECDLAWPYMCINPWINPYRSPPVTTTKVDMSKWSRTTRVFALISNAKNNFLSLLPPPVPSPAASADLFNDTYFVPPVDLAILPRMQVSAPFCCLIVTPQDGGAGDPAQLGRLLIIHER